MPTDILAAAQCGKCGDALDTNGSPKWCKKCRNDYQREYKDKQYDEAKTEGYSAGFDAGVTDCRRYLLQQFTRFPLAQFTGMDIINYVRSFELPKSNGTANNGSVVQAQNNVPLG